MALIPLAEAAARLNRSTSTLRHQIRNGALKAERYGRDWMVREAEVEKYRERHARSEEIAARYKGRKRKAE